MPFPGNVPPPHAPPRPIRGGRRPPRIDTSVVHGASVDGGGIIEMANNLIASDAIIKSLAALNFEGDKVSPEQIDNAIEESLGATGEVKGELRRIDRDSMIQAVESFDRAAVSVGVEGLLPDEDEEIGGASGGKGDELVAAFLEGLLSDD